MSLNTWQAPNNWLDSGLTVTATLGSINYSSKNTTVSVTGDVDIIATLGTIDYTSQDAAVIISGLIDITSTLGSIVYNSYPVIVSIGEGQVIGNVTTSFKPDTITVSFK